MLPQTSTLLENSEWSQQTSISNITNLVYWVLLGISVTVVELKKNKDTADFFFYVEKFCQKMFTQLGREENLLTSHRVLSAKFQVWTWCSPFVIKRRVFYILQSIPVEMSVLCSTHSIYAERRVLCNLYSILFERHVPPVLCTPYLLKGVLSF